MFEAKARIDFECEFNIASIFDEILNEYNAIIESDKLIENGFANIEKQRGLWKIDGFAKLPCGGTNVKSTSAVGFIQIK
jgi:Ser-tRNA(Ala) deacylase AlaX